VPRSRLLLLSLLIATAARAEPPLPNPSSQGSAPRPAPSRAEPGFTLTAASKPQGQLLRPVPGPIRRTWGQIVEGEPNNGIAFGATGPTTLLAPCAGRIMFAEPFRSYRMLLIIDCGGGYHIVLSGFDQPETSVGQTVRMGAPVGSLKGSAAVIGLELRQNGRPVNPTPWLKSTRW